MELLDIWADLTVITLRRLRLSAEGELLTLDCIGLLSSNDHKVISGAAQQPWPVPMVQALFRARVSCKEPYKVVGTSCFDGPCDRLADLSARDVPVAVSAQVTIEAPVMAEFLVQAGTTTDDELHNSPIARFHKFLCSPRYAPATPTTGIPGRQIGLQDFRLPGYAAQC